MEEEAKDFQNVFKIKYLAIALLFVFILFGFSELTKGNSPIEIDYLQDLDEIRNDLGEDYILVRDLDFDDNASYNQSDPDWNTKKDAWTSGEGWEPIGESGNPFEGGFDGDGHTISNLYIGKATDSYIGFFGYTISSANIKDIGLINIYVLGGGVCGRISWQK